jgi:hypothetical protein
MFIFRYFQGLSNDVYSITQSVHRENLHLTPLEADFVDGKSNILIRGEESIALTNSSKISTTTTSKSECCLF